MSWPNTQKGLCQDIVEKRKYLYIEFTRKRNTKCHVNQHSYLTFYIAYHLTKDMLSYS